MRVLYPLLPSVLRLLRYDILPILLYLDAIESVADRGYVTVIILFTEKIISMEKDRGTEVRVAREGKVTQQFGAPGAERCYDRDDELPPRGFSYFGKYCRARGNSFVAFLGARRNVDGTEAADKGRA